MKLQIGGETLKVKQEVTFRLNGKNLRGIIKEIHPNKSNPKDSDIIVDHKGEAGITSKSSWRQDKIKVSQINTSDKFAKVKITENMKVLNFNQFINESSNTENLSLNERKTIDLGEELQAAVDMIEAKLEQIIKINTDKDWTRALSTIEKSFDRFVDTVRSKTTKLGIIPLGESLNEKEYSEEERKALASKGMALSDGSFPIKNVEDLKNAIQAYGRSKDQPKAAKFIAKRAKALGASDLIPDTEDFQKSLKEDSNSILEGVNYNTVNSVSSIKSEKDLISILNTFDNFAEMSDDSKRGDRMYRVKQWVDDWLDDNMFDLRKIEKKLNDRGKTAIERHF